MTLTGENGLLTRTVGAKNKTTLAGMEEELNLAYMSVYTGKAGTGAINSGVSLDGIYNDTSLPSEVKSHIIRLGGVSTVSLVNTDQRNVTILAEDGAITSSGTVGTKTVSIQVQEGSNSYAYWLESEGVYYPMSISNSRVVLDKENTSTTEPTGEGSLGSEIEVKFIDSGATEAAETSSYVTKKSTSKSGNITTITLEAKGAGSTEVVVKSGNIGLTEGNIEVTVSPVYTINIGEMENGSVGITTRGNDTTSYTKYECGAVIQLNAIGNTTPQRYEFQKWNDNTETNPREITVSSTTAISTVIYTATFQISTSEIAKGINPETYGKYVNYNIDLGIGTANDVTDDWKVFYDDGTNIYIIAADYVPVSNTYLATAIANIGASTNGSYGVYWSDKNAYKTYKNGIEATAANGAADIFINRPTGTAYLEGRGMLGFWKSQTTNVENENAKMTACLIDTKAWESFSGGLPLGVSGTPYAIGGPTVSMWMESWNAIYPSDKLYYNKANSYGYYVNAGEQPTIYDGLIDSSVMNTKEGYNNTLYYPHQSGISNCIGYLLVSPSQVNYVGFFRINVNGSVEYNRTAGYVGVRPVVCLPSNVQLEIDSTNSNLYNIANATSANSN